MWIFLSLLSFHILFVGPVDFWKKSLFDETPEKLILLSKIISIQFSLKFFFNEGPDDVR